MKKIYVFLIVFILGIGVIMFLLFGLDSLKKEKYETALVVGDNTTWIYQNKRWMHVSSADRFVELSWQKYQVFDDNKSIGSYDLWHDDKWYIFDDQKNAIMPTGVWFAYKSNYNIETMNFTKEEFSEDEYVTSVLSSKDLPIDSKFTKAYKSSLDIDADGIIEDFYVISNVFSLNDHPEKVFSFVFMVKNNQIYYLYDDVRDYKVYAGCSPDIITFLDADADEVDELIVSCDQYSNLGRIDMLYNFDGESFKILISNQ